MLKQILFISLITLVFISCKQDVYQDNLPGTTTNPTQNVNPPRLSGLSTNSYAIEEAEELTGIVVSASIPEMVDLSFNMPPVINQGQQESCVAFTTNYYLKSYQEKIENNYTYVNDEGVTDYTTVMSPAFTYNTVKNSSSCTQKISIENALYSLKTEGANRWSDFAYLDNECTNLPTAEQYTLALRNKIESYHKVEKSATYPNLVLLIKNLLHQTYPVISAIKIDNDFRSATPLNEDDIYVFNQLNSVYTKNHTILLVGYDDTLNAFKFVNSWGTDWANEGYGYISYNFFLDNTDANYQEGLINNFVAFDAL